MQAAVTHKLPVPFRSRLILYASYLAAVMVLIDLTALNIALPTISRFFAMDMSQVSWLLVASMLSAGSFALIAGRIVEVYGAKNILVVGFLIFFVGNIGCFLSKDYYVLLTIRFLQGIGESFLYVTGPAYIRRYLPEKRRQSAYGIWMACTGIGIGFGPVIGGFLIAGGNWNLVFLINFFLSIIGVIAVYIARFTKIKRDNKPKAPDFLGAVYSFFFLSGLIFGINIVNRTEFSVALVYASFGLSALAFVLFLHREKTFTNPVFDLKLFRIQNFNLSMAGFFLFFLVNVGSRFLRPFYFENARFFSTEVSGLLMLVSPLVMMLVSPLVKKISEFISLKTMCITGNVLLAISMFMFAFWDAHTPVWFICFSMLLLGAGMGFYYPASSFIGMNSAPSHRSGMASAAISASKSIAKLFGVLLFAFLYTWIINNAPAVPENIFAFKMTFIFGALLAVGAGVLSTFIKKT